MILFWFTLPKSLADKNFLSSIYRYRTYNLHRPVCFWYSEMTRSKINLDSRVTAIELGSTRIIIRFTASMT